MRFDYTLETITPAERIWKLWTDVAGWPNWDTALVAAQLDGPFILNAQGRLQAKGSPESRFTVIDITPGQCYTIGIPLPLAQLRIRRELMVLPAGTRYTHEVAFVGPLGWLFGWLLGRQFRAMLPGVMVRLRQLAEQSLVP